VRFSTTARDLYHKRPAATSRGGLAAWRQLTKNSQNFTSASDTDADTGCDIADRAA